ncbi:Putative carboxylesterase, type B, carboxylesterase type B, carboxylesterase type B, active [Septoria linicola]|uniref:Carboxylic ester hydrolase n=1 Tax=Septoria linicola TaxID=215465 RepID=A0A9Q9B6X3_9PEZI|nr:Putative carboxylesterase, type B, carboxylesterase type B, carboxylesterase type B, active [Septoria linicola]
MWSSRLIAGLALAGSVSAVSPTVGLDYATYEGTQLNNGITQWLGLRYAAPPVGDLRFAAPQDPLKENSTVSAAEHGKVCLATGATGSVAPDDEKDEDCLFLDVYAPSNATAESELPVFFFIQGGGFNSLSNANYNGSGIVLAAEYDAIVVVLNYRVGIYGFLAGAEVEKDGSINAGLHDQRKALEWVQKYICQFGGNPKHVTLGGASAGAQSVVLHVTAYGGRDDGLFHASAAESQSFSALRTIEESQFAYDNIVIRTGCTSSNDTLACLRNLTATELQYENFVTPFPGAQKAPLYMFGPVLDYDFISDYTISLYEQGKFIKVPAIYGGATNEGTGFAYKNISTYGQSSTFLQSQFPALTPSQLGKINSLYPVEDTIQNFPNASRFWRQASDAYGDLRYTCPGQLVSGLLTNYSVPSWNYHWNVIDPPANASGDGVKHTIDVQAIFGPEYTLGDAPDSYKVGGVNHAIVDVAQGYWTSFIRTFDPNASRRAGTPVWEEWASSGLDGRRLRFETNSTAMEGISLKQVEKCEFTTSIGVAIKQ